MFVPLLGETDALTVSGMQEITLYLKGLTCSSCTNSVQNALHLLPGVISTDVHLDYCKIEFDDGILFVEELINAIEDCGFEASKEPFTESIQLTVKGMTCTSCVSAIQTALKELPEIVKADISLEKELATIQYHSLQPKDIIKAIEDCGFDAYLYEQKPLSVDMKQMVGSVFGKRSQPTSKVELEMDTLTLNSSKTARFEVHGMTCSACVKSIEDQLLSLKGIHNCSVALTLESALVEYDPIVISPEGIRDAIDDMGFEATILLETDNNEIELRILGMTCASCSGKIERFFQKYDGVVKCSVNLLGQTGRFEVIKSKVGVRDLIEGIESLGFNAFVPDNSINSQLESLQRTREIQKWRRQFWRSLSLAVPVSFISMFLPMISSELYEYPVLLKGLTVGTVSQLILTTPVQFGTGWTFYRQSYKALKYGSYTMDVLVALGTSLAYFYSVIAMLVCVYRGGHPPAQVFFEASSTLITFVTMGRYLENSAKAKTSNALSKLISLAPSHALLLEQDPETKQYNARQIPSDYIKVGDLLKILPGERIPCDGTVEFGQSSVDESVVTGEPIPVEKQKSDKVITGTVNGSGAMHVRAERVGNDTTLSQIVKLVSSAQASKAPIQAVADQVAAVFVPTVIFLGLLTFIGWMLIIQCLHWIPASFPHDSNPLFVCLSMCISVIVVACPCALGLATPTAVMVGTGVGAKLGILIKGGGPLETARRITKIVFDKTGTLTLGNMSVHTFDVFPNCTIPKHELLKMVGLVESNSEHPIGRSIVEFAPAPYVDDIVQCTSVPGSGMRASVLQKRTGKTLMFTIGNLQFIQSHNCQSTVDVAALERLHETQGRTVIFVAVDNTVVSLVALADTVKPEAAAVVRALQRMGIQVAMVTGDQELTAHTIATQCGIMEVHAGVSPSGKQSIVSEMQRTDVVAFVGDGVNDSASLAQSDLGIAVYGGTDVAVAAASVVLMRPDLRDVITAIDLSRTIFKRIWLNFLFASVYNMLMIPLAMGFGAPWGITLPAMVSGMAMSMSSVSVVLSSLLLQWYRRPNIESDGTVTPNPPSLSEFVNDTRFDSNENLFEPHLVEPKSLKDRIFSTFWSMRGKMYQKIDEEVV